MKIQNKVKQSELYLIILIYLKKCSLAPCRPGHFQNEGHCKPCPERFYKDTEGNTNCTSCVTGTTTETSGAVSHYYCSKFSEIKKEIMLIFWPDHITVHHNIYIYSVYIYSVYIYIYIYIYIYMVC